MKYAIRDFLAQRRPAARATYTHSEKKNRPKSVVASSDYCSRQSFRGKRRIFGGGITAYKTTIYL